jgi:exopolyphosphatase/guanosine-5'-triphosphate,3'-diphosphate pyrophosphatase
MPLSRKTTARTPRRDDSRGDAPIAPVTTAEGLSLLAVIDIGSRALRMAVGEVFAGQPIRRLETLSAPVSIGIDTFARGRIRAATTEAVVQTLNDFLLVAKGYGLEPADCRAVATTAVRDARNREVFLERVQHGSGLRVEVLEAIEETRLIHQLVRDLLGEAFDHGTRLLLALGAGGTQIVLQQEGVVVLAETRRVGLMRLRSGASGRQALGAARTFLGKALGSIGRIHDLEAVDALVVINDELNHLIDGLAKGVERSEGGLRVPRAALTRLFGQVTRTSAEAIVERTALDHNTVETARLALEELAVFCELAPNASEVMLPYSSMLDSLLLDMKLLLDQQQGGGGRERAIRQVEQSAWAVARKYRVDTRHAARVRELALQLFDALRRFTTLADRSRLLLSVAAILHDIGVFVSAQGHEQHTAYLVRNSQIMGLSRAEIDRVALMARSHRRPAPLLDSPELTSLSASDRVELLKLSALLRMADALDGDSNQRVERVEVELSAEALDVRAFTRTGDREAFASIARQFKQKSDLCEELFGVEARLTEVLLT